MKKMDYLLIGGWDETYPKGLVADWDFMMKCSMNGFDMMRTFDCLFYHFVSQSVNGEERQLAEQQAHQYAKYKWGSYIKHDPITNIKSV